MRKIKIGDYVLYRDALCRVLKVDPYSVMAMDGSISGEGLLESDLIHKLSLHEEGVGDITERFGDSGNVVKLIDDNSLPITREFIESFGFEVHRDLGSCIVYRQTSSFGGTLELWDHFHGVFSLENIDDNGVVMILFSRYRCTTRSELRFLLTKGRVNCSK